MTPETVPKICTAFCYWAGIGCGVACAYCFLFAPIEYVAFGIILFGAAIGLQLIAAVLTRNRTAMPGDGQAGGPDAPPD